MNPAQHVGVLSILCMCVSLLICVALPVGLAIWASRRYKKAFSLMPVVWGAAGFIISQMVIRMPLIQFVLPQFGWFQALTGMPWLYAVILSLTAGLFEETARFVVFGIMKKRRAYPDGLSYGAGHGGIEAILIVGLTLVNYIIYSIMINAGAWEALMKLVPASYQSQYESVRQLLVSSDPWSWLVSGVERIFAFCIQVGLSLVVLKGFQTNRKWLFLLVAVFLHGIVDFPAALQGLGIIHWPVWVMEGTICAEAALAVWFTAAQAKAWRKGLAADAGIAVQPSLT